MIFLDANADCQNDRRNNINTNNDKRRANNCWLLESVVEEPIVAVIVFVVFRFFGCFIDYLVLVEFDTQYFGALLDEILQAVTMHEADSLRLILLHVIPSYFFKIFGFGIIWALHIDIKLLFEFIGCLLKPNDECERDGNEYDGNKPVASDHCAAILAAIAEVLPVDVVRLARRRDFRILFKNMFLLQLSSLFVAWFAALAAAKHAAFCAISVSLVRLLDQFHGMLWSEGHVCVSDRWFTALANFTVLNRR